MGEPARPVRTGLRVFALVLLVTGILVAGGVVIATRNETEQRKRTIDETVGFAEAAARSADQVLSDSIALLNLIAASPVLNEIPASQVQAVLDAIDVSAAGFTGGVSWVSEDGLLLAASGRDPNAGAKDLNDDPAVKAILGRGAKQYVSSGFMDPVSRDDSVTVAVPAIDAAGNRTGLVMGTLSLERVAAHLTGFRFGGNDLIVVDRASQILIAADRAASVGTKPDRKVLDALRRDSPGALTSATDPLGRDDRLLAAASSPVGDWLVLVSRPESEAFGPDIRNLRLELIALALAALCSIGLAFYGARKLNALQSMADEAVRLRQSQRERAAQLRVAMVEVGTATNREELAQIVVGSGRRALGSAVAALTIQDDDPRMLRWLAVEGSPPDLKLDRSRYPLKTTAPAGWVIANGEPLFLKIAEFVERFDQHALDYQQVGCESIAVLPLMARDVPIGALLFGFTGEEALDAESQLELVQYSAEAGHALSVVHDREMEHEFALTLQRDLLPAELGAACDITVTARYIPANDFFDVGGDWYDMIQRPDGSTMLVVGDVVGHGVAAIAAMGQLSSVCRAMSEDCSPAKVLEHLDRLAARVPSAEGTSLAIVLIAADRRQVDYCIAGHPRPLVVERGQVRELDGGVSLPLGYGDLKRSQATTSLQPNASIVLFTDGLVERREASYEDRVALLRRVTAASPPAELCDSIVSKMTKAGHSTDDTVVMVVEVGKSLDSTAERQVETPQVQPR